MCREYFAFVLARHCEVLKYLAVGAAVFVLYFFLIYLFITICKLEYLFGVSIAYVVAVSSHFALNKVYTFRAKGHTRSEIAKYITLLFVNYVVTMVTVYLSVELLDLSSYLGVVFSIMITFFTGYFASKMWVFNGGLK